MTLSRYTLFVLIAICIVSNFIFFPANIISYDVFGYYLYLPFSHIYHDLGLTNQEQVETIISQYHNTEAFYQAMKMPNGNWLMKYSMGMAVLYAPFYFIGHLFALILGFPADGFSYPYQVALWAGGVIYTLTGLYFLHKLLIRYFSDTAVAIVLVLTYLGTNYYFHSSFFGQNAMSHNYLFTLYALLLWYTDQWHKNGKLKNMLAVGAVCGLMTLSRPTEIVCMAIPLFWNITSRASLKQKITLLLQKKWQVVLFAGMVAGIGSLQFIYWRIYAGQFFVNSYGGNPGEGLELFRPYTLQVLFSYRKGWFVYTPVMVFSLVGLIIAVRKKAFYAVAVTLYFVANLYLVSSWSCWWYAGCFSQRALIPSYAVLALPLAAWVDFLFTRKPLVRIAGVSVLAVLLCFNLFQTWQFRVGILPQDRTTKAYYWKIFGKTSANPAWKSLLLIDHYDFTVFNRLNEYHIIRSVQLTFDKDTGSTYVPGDSLKTNAVYMLTSQQNFSPAIEFPYHTLTSKDHILVRAGTDLYYPHPPEKNSGSFVVTFLHKYWAHHYRTVETDQADITPGRWVHLELDYISPDLRSTKDVLKMYMWYRGQDTVYVDNLAVTIYEKND